MTGPTDVASDVDRCRQCGQTVPDTIMTSSHASGVLPFRKHIGNCAVEDAAVNTSMEVVPESIG